MSDSPKTPERPSILISAACFVVVVAGMRAASPIVVPFLLSVFIAVICAPPLFWLQRRGIPNSLAILLILVGVVGLGFLLAAVIGTSLNDFMSNLPVYQQRLGEKTAGGVKWLQEHRVDISDEVLKGYVNPGRAMQMIGNTLAGLSGVLTNTFMILLTVLFILLEASGFPKKLKDAMGESTDSLGRFKEMTASINRYLAIKTAFSAVTGLLVWVWLSILGVDYPLLWGVVAFLLNYVPNIGSIIAAIPAVLLAIVQIGFGSALMTTIGYLAINVVIGSFLEPKFMGKGLGLSTLVVFLSLVFWGWVLGPVGMLLSVPLTMILKIALEAHDDTRWISVMLGS